MSAASRRPSGSADSGFVYVATGKRYADEARASAASLRRHHPDTRICLIADRQPEDVFWDDFILLDHPHFGFRDKLAMQRAPYSRCVFLDTDTTICGDLSPLFTILARYDVCGIQLSEGQDYVMEGGIPSAFPEMNGGVIGFRAGAATAEFFSLWERYYEEFQALNRPGHYHYANVGDQKSLRAALWHSNVRHACVGGEFGFIPFRLEFASLPVAMLHTRATAGLDTLAARLNAQLGRRVYVPSLDAVIGDSLSPPEARRLAVAIVKYFLRHAGRVCMPRALRSWLRRQPRFVSWLFGNRYSGSSAGHEAKWQLPPGR